MKPALNAESRSGAACQFPVDFDAVAIHAAIPCTSFLRSLLRPGILRLPMHCLRENVDFDFRLVEPASMSGLVVNGEPIPDVAADFLVEQVRERLYAAKASFG